MNIKKEHFHLKKSVILIFIASLSFSIMALLVKFAAKRTTIDIMITFRFTISFLYILVLLLIRKGLKKTISLKTGHIYMHISRAVVSLITMVLLYLSLRYIPIVDANLLFMTNALFVPIVGFLFLRHKIIYKHWLAIIIGFVGVAFILKPGYELFDPHSLLALFAGIGAAISLLLVRKLSKFDQHYVCMFYYFLIAFLISGIYAIFTWVIPDFTTFLFLVGIGVFGSFYQDLLIRASSYASAKITSSLLYATLVFSMVFDWWFFAHIPSFLTWIGIILVVFSSILTIYAARQKKEVLK